MKRIFCSGASAFGAASFLQTKLFVHVCICFHFVRQFGIQFFASLNISRFLEHLLNFGNTEKIWMECLPEFRSPEYICTECLPEFTYFQARSSELAVTCWSSSWRTRHQTPAGFVPTREYCRINSVCNVDTYLITTPVWFIWTKTYFAFSGHVYRNITVAKISSTNPYSRNNFAERQCDVIIMGQHLDKTAKWRMHLLRCMR